MHRLETTLAAHHVRRRCLNCGFGGRSIQGADDCRRFRCPRCDADLYARPPRSYAEMEGLELAPDDAGRADPVRRAATPSAATRTFVTAERGLVVLAVLLGAVVIVAASAGAV